MRPPNTSTACGPTGPGSARGRDRRGGERTERGGHPAATIVALALLAAAGSSACSPPPPPVADASQEPECQPVLPAPHVLPGTRPEHRDPGFWISRIEDPDAVVLTPAEIDESNQRALRLSQEPAGIGARFALLDGSADAQVIVGAMQKGIDRHRAAAAEGHRFVADGGAPPEAFFGDLERIQRAIEPARTFHVVARLTDLRCHPTAAGLYEAPGDTDFDLLLCSTLRPGDAVRVISRHADGWTLVRSPHVEGWIQDGGLGPEITTEAAASFLGSERFVVVTEDRAPLWASAARRNLLATARVGLRLPLLEEERAGLVRVLAPSSDGLREGFVEADAVNVGYLPFTRRLLVTHAFRQLDDTFGWAGAAGDRDCSAFLLDLFSLFGLQLPRNSQFQSLAGSYAIDTSAISEAEKSRAFEHALERGVALAFMPGHIMLLLGRDGPDWFAIHQFSGYRVGCRPGHDVKMAVDRVSVTTLRLGEGSERRSFVERISRVAVFGHE